VQISAENSGLTIQNYKGERAIVSGAVPLSGLEWKPYDTRSPKDNAFVADVSAAKLKECPGLHLDGMRVTRARFPNGNVELPERTQPDSGNRDGILLIPGSLGSWKPPDHSLIADIRQVVNTNTSQTRNGSVYEGKVSCHATVLYFAHVEKSFETFWAHFVLDIASMFSCHASPH